VIMELGNSKRRNGFSNFIEVTGLFDWQKNSDSNVSVV